MLMTIVAIATTIQLTWLMLDRSVPTWDDASHFTNALLDRKTGAAFPLSVPKIEVQQTILFRFDLFQSWQRWQVTVDS